MHIYHFEYTNMLEDLQGTSSEHKKIHVPVSLYDAVCLLIIMIKGSNLQPCE